MDKELLKHKLLQVDVLSRSGVRALEPDPNKCLISIWTADYAYDQEADQIPMDGWHDVLRLDFHDVVEHVNQEGFNPVPFDAVHADKTIRFIFKNLNRDFVIHCDAGLSRSVAIASFMKLGFSYEPVYHECSGDYFRNILVFNELTKAYWKWVDENNQFALEKDSRKVKILGE